MSSIAFLKNNNNKKKKLEMFHLFQICFEGDTDSHISVFILLIINYCLPILLFLKECVLVCLAK